MTRNSCDRKRLGIGRWILWKSIGLRKEEIACPLQIPISGFQEFMTLLDIYA